MRPILQPAQGSSRAAPVTLKPVVPRARAYRDIEAAVAWYLPEAGEETALQFIAALEKAYAHNPAFRLGPRPAVLKSLALRGCEHCGYGDFLFLSSLSSSLL